MSQVTELAEEMKWDLTGDQVISMEHELTL